MRINGTHCHPQRAPKVRVPGDLYIFTFFFVFISNLSFAENPIRFISQCQDHQDTQTENQPIFARCLHLKYEIGTLIGITSPYSQSLFDGGEIYYALHPNEYFSIHASGNRNHRGSYNRNSFDLFALQLGNPSSHPLRFMIGKLPIAFGLNHMPVGQFFLEQQSIPYWRSLSHGMRLELDNLINTQLEIGFNFDQFDQESLLFPENRKSSFSSRFIYDFSALEGSRLIFSIETSNFQTRRYGGTYLNHNRRGDETAFEWVRLLDKNDPQIPFRQILRLSHLSTFRRNSRWGIMYEDELKQYRQFSFAHDYAFFELLLLKAGFSYNKNLDLKHPYQWFFLTSLGAEW